MILLGLRYHFTECPFVLEDEPMAYFLPNEKDIPSFNLAEKETFLHLLFRTARTQGKAGIKLLASTC